MLDAITDEHFRKCAFMFFLFASEPNKPFMLKENTKPLLKFIAFQIQTLIAFDF
ncbi:hypothetical protein SDC9_143876 [bioreactor metagenome]|uniref:Uncharacterized protein n=1 Tax=bioreactor metagenome TaxID=1076179 RepID=A0A645E561_9ZZZZ